MMSIPANCETVSLNSEAGVLDEPYSAQPAQWSSHTGPARQAT
jgi:hypothetical protein